MSDCVCWDERAPRSSQHISDPGRCREADGAIAGQRWRITKGSVVHIEHRCPLARDALANTGSHAFVDERPAWWGQALDCRHLIVPDPGNRTLQFIQQWNQESTMA